MTSNATSMGGGGGNGSGGGNGGGGDTPTSTRSMSMASPPAPHHHPPPLPPPGSGSSNFGSGGGGFADFSSYSQQTPSSASPSANSYGNQGLPGSAGGSLARLASSAVENPSPTADSAPDMYDRFGHGHYFSKKTFHKPTYCHHCTDMLWGIIGQGFICEGEFGSELEESENRVLKIFKTRKSAGAAATAKERFETADFEFLQSFRFDFQVFMNLTF